MKMRFRLFVMALLGFALFLNLGQVYAQEETNKPEPFALDGTEWAVQMFYTDAKGEQKTGSDKLIFKDGKFTTENLEERGFSESNYTLSVKGGSTVFETMQSKDKDRAFWRGEVRDNYMKGILSIHNYKSEDQKVVEDYTFGGGLASGAIVETEKAEKAIKEAELTTQELETPTNATVATVATEAQKGEQQSMGDKLKAILQRLKGQKTAEQQQ
jgi:hypothetical protein